MRPSGRAPDQMRSITIEPRFTKHAEGSVLIGFGDTKVLVTASIEEKVPPFLALGPDFRQDDGDGGRIPLCTPIDPP